MDSNHLMGIIMRLLDYVLAKHNYNKQEALKAIQEMGWTEFDLKWLGLDWMFEENGK